MKVRTSAIRSIFLVAILFAAQPAPGLMPTGVGTGGDVLDQFLAVTRAMLVDTLESIRNDSEQQSVCECSRPARTNFACAYLRSLTAPQREYCRAFVLQTAAQILDLNEGEKKIGFRISSLPLYVSDPQGKPRAVVAATLLGPEGDISFHYDSIRSLPPIGLLFVMAHEFGHKASFADAGFIDDNSTIGPFHFAGGGRAMMDSVGSAVALYAAEHGIIGQSFGLDDKFSCRIKEKHSGMAFKSQGPSARLFFNHLLDSYESGVGRYPQDFSCQVSEPDDVSQLFLRVQIHEEQGCRSRRGARRWTLLQLWRLFDKESRDDGKPPVKLQSRVISAWNPLCGALPSEPVRLDFSVGERIYSFEVQYEGSESKMLFSRKETRRENRPAEELGYHIMFRSRGQSGPFIPSASWFSR